MTSLWKAWGAYRRSGNRPSDQHDRLREIVRGTTKPGSPERKAGFAAARRQAR